MQLRQLAAAFEVELLAADHPESRGDELTRDRGPRVGERQAERLCEERVAGEDRGRLAVRGPDRRRAAALAVVVQRREVVVHERERVHELHRRRSGQEVLDRRTDCVSGRQEQHGPHALAAERMAHRLGEAAEVRGQRELVEVPLDACAELVRPQGHRGPAASRPPSRPRASRAAAPPRPPSRARQAPAGSRSPGRGPASPRAAPARTRASRAGSPRSTATLPAVTPPPPVGFDQGCRSPVLHRRRRRTSSRSRPPR